ncbi:FAD-binding oxidoreductase [Streptomyces sp. NBC_01239]|uniref:FAD-dependent oxidoreductase n=1 Tax=Streptomyces sp. NBC_01239 TaxID=2903792 RepID=UPI0022525E4D|nr:FAD-dependent oxidoreductase [Streptomyces sp. NBC_01239]MCX4816649.1 FAD-binding oxidoreductase [Streptomyces sp. NBC_01239]
MVVGAGITGASIAHHLALRGIPVTVVEQAPEPGAGATGRSGGMVRGYDPDPAVGELAVPSLAAYRDPARWASGQAPLRAVGAITVTDPADEPALIEAADRVNHGQAPSAYVVTGREEIMGVRLDDGAALVEPDAGWVPPLEVTRDWLGQAVTNGASLHFGVRVLGVEGCGGRPVVRTTAGDIRAEAVVAATGLWTARPPQGLRPSPPVRSRSIQISIVRREPPAAAHATFIDLRTGVYARPVDANHSLIGMPHLVWDSPFDSAYDPAHARATAQAVGIHLPWAAGAEQVSVVRAADGYGEHSGILAPTRVPHVWSVRGWNGGGVKTAPEAGRRIADTLFARAFTHDT